MADPILRALHRTRQVRQFTDEPVGEDDLQAIMEVVRWTGSSQNQQLWQFLVVRDRAIRQRIGEVTRYARYVGKAPLAIAIVMPGEDTETDAYDEGRAAERILIAANALGLGAGIGWTDGDERAVVGSLLGIKPPAFVRTIMSVGHPTEAAMQQRSGPGTGRKPTEEIVREL